MRDDLYFVPILARAVGLPDTRRALKEAFARIRSLAPSHPRGFAQFCDFMMAAAENYQGEEDQSTEQAVVERLIIELATESFEGGGDEKRAAQELVYSNRDGKRRLEALKGELDEFSTPPVLHLVLYQDNRPRATIQFGAAEARQTVGKITPGTYRLELGTGRVIWEEQLGRKDLIWSAAFPGKALPLAADTGRHPRSATRESTSAGGSLVIRVVPDIEAGSIQVERRP